MPSVVSSDRHLVLRASRGPGEHPHRDRLDERADCPARRVPPRWRRCHRRRAVLPPAEPVRLPRRARVSHRDRGAARRSGPYPPRRDTRRRAPRLFVTGESLGSFGGGEAFDDLDDMVANVDHALWVGAPEFAHLRREAEAERAPGSLQIAPDLGDEGRILFANRAFDLVGTSPQVVFPQQGDDPIVWWDFPTLLRRPDWLAEPLDPSVNPDLRWRPLSTFLNLTVDMAVGNDFDEDHGHLYGTQPLTAWAAMLQLRAWDVDRVLRLRVRLQGIQR